MTTTADSNSPKATSGWPGWPISDDGLEAQVVNVLRSQRWAVSEMNTGERLLERQFADAFASWEGVAYAVPCANGSSALTIAFEALNLPRGSEVLVPGMTWVACASAVANVGLVPVLVDVDPATLCMSPQAALAAVNERTSAVLVVHLGSNMADMDFFVEFCHTRGLALVEDCAQAHGSEWRGSKAGSFGQVGIFSMQESKVLTCGEGGVAVTNDHSLYELMQEYRADGRRYAADEPPKGSPELAEVGTVQGRNLCLSEIHAAILLHRLGLLDEQNRSRAESAARLDAALTALPGLHPLRVNENVTRRTFYQYNVHVDLESFAPGFAIEHVRQRLSAQLGVFCAPPHHPLNKSPLYCPQNSPEKFDKDLISRIDPSAYHLPGAQMVYDSYVNIPHQCLLAGAWGTDAIFNAFAGVHQELSQ